MTTTTTATTKVLDGVTDTYSYDAHDKLTGIRQARTRLWLRQQRQLHVRHGRHQRHEPDLRCREPGHGHHLPRQRNQQLCLQWRRPANAEGRQQRHAELCQRWHQLRQARCSRTASAVYTPGLSERRGSASKFYHADALGCTRGITDSTQTVTDSHALRCVRQDASAERERRRRRSALSASSSTRATATADCNCSDTATTIPPLAGSSPATQQRREPTGTPTVTITRLIEQMRKA